MEINHKLVKANSDRGVILLPGISGGVFTSYYNEIEQALNKKGFNFLRFEIWNDSKEIQGLTLNKIYKRLDEAINFMESSGCKKISLLGKSFGGAIALTCKNKEIKSVVAWAPAFSFEENSNLEDIKNKKIKGFKSPSQFKINKQDIKEDIPLLIIHGDKDSIIPLNNSKKIKEKLERLHLKVVKNADHNYSNPEEMKVVAYHTAEFFNKFS